MEWRRRSQDTRTAWNEEGRVTHGWSPQPWAVREYQKTTSHVLKSLMNEEK